MKRSINIQTELFIITQNDLNKQVLKDANKHNFEIIS